MGTLRYRIEIGWLFQAGMVIFLVTVAIGIANGTKIFGTLDRAVLLTHVHAGTLGWITLGVTAACLWMSGGATSRATNESIARGLTTTMIIVVPLYVAAFYTGNFILRALFGIPVLAGIVFLLGWLSLQARRIGWSRLTVPQLSAVAGITTLVIGSTIGVYTQIAFARGEPFDASAAIGGHVSAQVVGYLVLLGMALIEWVRRPDAGPASLAGRIQVALLFVGGVLIAISLLLNAQQVAGIAVLFELLALIVFVVRVGWAAVRTSWTAVGPARHAAVAVPFLVFNVGSILYLILALFVLQIYKDFSEVPMSVAITLDHAMFVGVMTNLNFAMLQQLTANRRAILAWADNWIFWGLNAGVAAFIVVLLANITFFERFTAPVMGTAILLALVTYTVRLRSAPVSAAAVAPA